MENTIQNSHNYNNAINTAIVGTTGTLGVLGGMAKSHFSDKPDVQKGLEGEFYKYKRAVALNELNIKDEFVRQTKNQELRDKFNNLCDYWYNTGLKKANRKKYYSWSSIWRYNWSSRSNSKKYDKKR